MMMTETIRQTEQLWQEQPEKAKGRPAVKGRAEGSQAVLEAGTFSWRADLPQPLGGSNAAPSPTALLLSALAGCAVVFVRDTLGPQLGIEVTAVEATASCATDARGLLGMEGAAPELGDVQLQVQVDTPQGEDGVRRIFEVWEQRCPIYLALVRPTPVSLSVRALAPTG
jgi:uncharacterized OsmC-like protein